QHVFGGPRDYVTGEVLTVRVDEGVVHEVRIRVTHGGLQSFRRLRDQRKLEAVAARLPSVDEVVAARAAGHLERDQLVVDLDGEQRELIAVLVREQAPQSDLEVGR